MDGTTKLAIAVVLVHIVLTLILLQHKWAIDQNYRRSTGSIERLTLLETQMWKLEYSNTEKEKENAE